MHSEQLPDGEEAAWQWCSLPSAASQQGWSLCQHCATSHPPQGNRVPQAQEKRVTKYFIFWL